MRHSPALFALVLALSPLAAAATPGPADAVPAKDAVGTLLEQAAFWRAQGRADLAVQAMQRVYALAPRDPAVIRHLGLFAVEDGDLAAARGWLGLLRRVAPDDDGAVAGLEAALSRATPRTADPAAVMPQAAAAATTPQAAALAHVRQDAQGPLRGPAARYAGHVALLAGAGLDAEALALLNRLEQTPGMDRDGVARLNAVVAAARADRLRAAGQLAEAYDVIAMALALTADDAGLQAALARLYDAGGLHREALAVYGRLLTVDPDDPILIRGAVDAAIGAGDPATAGRLLATALARLPGDPDLRAAADRLAAGRGTPAVTTIAMATGNPFRRAEEGPADVSAPTTLTRIEEPAAAPARPRILPRILPARPTIVAAPAPPAAPDRPRPVATEAALMPRTAASGATSGGLYLPGSEIRSVYVPPEGPAETTAPAGTVGAYGQPLTPPQVTYPPPGAAPVAVEYAAAPSPALANDPMARDIDRQLAELREQTVAFVRGDVRLRSRDGESGLSELTELGADFSASVSPFGDGRLTLTATPISLDAGTASDIGAQRFALNPLVPTEVTETNRDELETLVTSNPNVWNYLTTEQKSILGAAITAPTVTPLADFTAANPDIVAALSSDLQTAITDALAANADAALSTFVTLNPTIRTFLTTAQEATLDAAIATEIYAFDSARLAALRRAPSQKTTGLGLNLAYANGPLTVDVGTSPLGFAVENVVGGVNWTPRLSDTAQVSITAERRAVTDSMLAFAGTEDPFTGETWGGVTRTGGRVMFASDDGNVGLYAGGGYYELEGENVADNSQVEATVGAYFRPYRTERSELKVGLNLSYTDYDRNLGEFTFGHGGYFSPQNLISLAIPVDYEGKSRDGKWQYGLGGAIGYQSYDKEASPYFPTNAAYQSILDQEADAGLISSSYYPAVSESGVGGNIHGSFDYEIDDRTTVGGAASYDSFGEFSESSVMFYVKHLVDEVLP
ncbi:BCSC C-terminal domain-containing protein [Zavarzinia compransoris]|uniref:cellulose synthase subunit BcsC-related outer membrane protein n=1 Tax=Zavarzinia marina TaxID=2911065 RepID=UPI001EF235FA|nr:cellulose synthase subunit BcsC-related outer membrane protein [Zavarzinia marina]MCF4166139.1 BCSC C-terminal domain-containing protein [Zavarzinia marina]